MARATIMMGCLLGFGLVASTAAAQGNETTVKQIDAPRRSFEISTGVGYAQGAGTSYFDGQQNSELAGPGVEVAIEPGYRVTERWYVGAYATLAAFDRPDSVREGRVRGVSFGGAVQYHFDPMKRFDPWVSLGTGYRGVSLSGAGDRNVEMQGIQLARFMVGLDVRTTPGFAFGPVVGVDATMFTSWRLPRESSVHGVASEDLAITPFVFGGLMGRFDVVNKRAIASDRRVVALF